MWWASARECLGVCGSVWRCSGDVLGCSVALLGVSAVGNSVGPTVCMQTVAADRVSNSSEAGDCCCGHRRGPLVISCLCGCSGDVLGCSVVLLGVSAVGNSGGPTVCMQTGAADRVSNSREAGDCCCGHRREVDFGGVTDR